MFVSPHYETSWAPSWEFLLFLAMLAGIDVTAFAIKRLTHVTDDGEAVGQKMRSARAAKNEPAEPVDEDIDETATTDLQDLDERG